MPTDFSRFIAAVALAMVALSSPALAQSQVLQDTCQFAADIAQWLVGIGYVCGVIGLAMVSMRASVQGRFSLGGFGGIMLGMFTLAMIPSIIGYIISGQFGWTNC